VEAGAAAGLGETADVLEENIPSAGFISALYPNRNAIGKGSINLTQRDCFTRHLT